jgi:alkylhydroperoxidase/carboxymuconolactone decarboxylase family protein YurZ
VNHLLQPAIHRIPSWLLFGDVWERPGLSKRDRSLITVAAVAEATTHLAFYTGWPNAINAVAIARETFPGGRQIERNKGFTKPYGGDHREKPIG